MTFTYEVRDGIKAMVLQESEAFRTFARDSEELLVYDADGEIIGTIVPAPAHVWENATRQPEEDAEAIRRAHEGMKEAGSIPWEQLNAELGI